MLMFCLRKSFSLRDANKSCEKKTLQLLFFINSLFSLYLSGWFTVHSERKKIVASCLCLFFSVLAPILNSPSGNDFFSSSISGCWDFEIKIASDFRLLCWICYFDLASELLFWTFIELVNENSYSFCIFDFLTISEPNNNNKNKNRMKIILESASDRGRKRSEKE